MLDNPARGRARFITFEGGEGVGKSTQVRRLLMALKEAGISAIRTREPGGTPRAEAIRTFILQGRSEAWGPRAEAVLFAAARLDRGEGREMLFATLCGSSWYYGRSGCTLFGYLRQAPMQDWREAYHSEGMALYVDATASHGGWPDLVTLEPGGITPIHWKWNGEAYELRDPQVAVDEAGLATPDP